MKIRIKGNSIRLRLTEPEVMAFLEYESISDVIEIPGQPLVYNLEKTSAENLTVSRLAGSIRVGMPSKLMEEWRNDDCIGFKHNFPVGDDKNILIVVEKDFKCLKERPKEDESNLFTNPEVQH